jgi:hypothetical protein
MFAMCALEDVIERAGDVNLVFPAHCRIPEGLEVSELPVVEGVVDAQKMRKVLYRFNHAKKK